MTRGKTNSRTLTPTKQLRADTAQVLFQILDNGQSAREALPMIQQSYSEQDKAWIQEMVYGVLRQLPILQFWLRTLLDKPLKNRFKVIEHLIMVGFYQIAFSRVSTHAAVSETVEGVAALNGHSLKGLVNAILRNFIRQEMVRQIPDDPIIQSGLPKWLYKRLITAYPDSISQLIESINAKAPIWLRVNRQKIELVEFAELLKQREIEFSLSDQHADAIVLTKSQDITLLPGFEQGFFAVQDGAAQLCADYLDPQPNERLLDCCAAPGGKTCHILERQSKLKEVVALDIDQQRMLRVTENLSRLGLHATISIGDATSTESWWDGQQFDRILLDAPCSATGVIRRHPDIKWLRKSSDIDALCELQQRILDQVWTTLKPGGTLLYATCSILPEENVQQISGFLARTPSASLSAITDTESATKPGRQILPGQGQMDGFYFARLIKS